MGLWLDWASRTGALDRRRATIDRPVIDLLLLHVNAGVFNPCLGRLSASVLDRKSPTLDRSHRLHLLLDPLLAFPNSCPLSPKLKAYKTKKTQKESKIE